MGQSEYWVFLPEAAHNKRGEDEADDGNLWKARKRSGVHAPEVEPGRATATIVRGFLHVEVEGLFPVLKADMDRAVEISGKSLL